MSDGATESTPVSALGSQEYSTKDIHRGCKTQLGRRGTTMTECGKWDRAPELGPSSL